MLLLARDIALLAVMMCCEAVIIITAYSLLQKLRKKVLLYPRFSLELALAMCLVYVYAACCAFAFTAILVPYTLGRGSIDAALWSLSLHFRAVLVIVLALAAIVLAIYGRWHRTYRG